jgi:hypothetical protein
MGLEDVIVEVLGLLGTPVDGRRLTVAARGHRVELDVARVSVRPPSIRAITAPPLPPMPRSWSEWAASMPGWTDWSAWSGRTPWAAAEAAWPALGRVELALRDIAVDGRTPFEVLDVTAAEVLVELASPATLVARDLNLRVEASCAALEAWLPPDLTVRVRPDGHLGVTRRGWDRVGEVTATLSVVDGLLQVELGGVEVRGIRLRAPARWQRRYRLDPATYHPGLRFEEVRVDPGPGRVRARLHLGEWREPVSFEQLGDLRSSLARRAPVTLRSLLGGG